MKLCPNCGTQNADQYAQCVSCGTVLPAAAPQPVYSGGGYVPPAYQPQPPVSMGAWFGWSLLCAFLPILGAVIMMLTAKQTSAKNFAKAMIVVQIIFGVIGAASSATLIAAIRSMAGM